jgi:hypothetical protein
MQTLFKLYIWNNINLKGPEFLVGYSSKMLGEGNSTKPMLFQGDWSVFRLHSNENSITNPEICSSL